MTRERTWDDDISRDRLKFQITAVLLLATLIAGIFGGQWGWGKMSGALERAETLEAAIPTLVLARDAAEAVADSVTRQALKIDTLIVAVTDTVRIEIEVARGNAALAESSFTNAVDSLRARLDSTGIRILGRLVGDHEITRSEDAAAFTAQGRLLATALTGLSTWRASSFAKDTVIAGWDSLYTVKSAANDALHDHIRGQERRKWGERVVAVTAVACAFLCG